MKIPLNRKGYGWWFGLTWSKSHRAWGFYHMRHDGCPMRAIWLGKLAIEWWWE